MTAGLSVVLRLPCFNYNFQLDTYRLLLRLDNYSGGGRVFIFGGDADMLRPLTFRCLTVAPAGAAAGLARKGNRARPVTPSKKAQASLPSI